MIIKVDSKQIRKYIKEKNINRVPRSEPGIKTRIQELEYEVEKIKEILNIK